MRSAVLAAIAGLALVACGQQQAAEHVTHAAPSPVATTAPAGTYAIDPNHVSVTARISHLGLSHYAVRFNATSGALTIDPANPSAAHIDATVQIASLDTPYRGDFREHHASSPYRSFEEEITKTPDLLNVAQFPTANFNSTSVTLTGPDTADIVGDLTLRGVTKPITLHAIFRGGFASHPMMPGAPPEMGFSATATFKRSDFGMNAFMGPLGDDIDLEIEADLIRQADSAASPAQTAH